jgi:DNA modification methylase
LDPPFNSNANYNVLFAEKDGTKAASQIRAFDDTWTWDQEDEAVFAKLVMAGGKVADVLQAFRTFLGTCDLLAYLVMMAPRLIELRRVLKSTGSIYLHCDPAASHYLKMLMDAVFGPENFLNEIIWRRTSAHGNATTRFASIHDVIFSYSRSSSVTWNQRFEPYDEEYIAEHFVHSDPDGRLFRRVDLRNPASRPNLVYDFKASNGKTYKPHPNGWAVSEEKMRMLDAEGRLFFPAKADGRMRRKLYLDESPGKPVADIWDDIRPIFATAAERLGYPTQKPEALLERIILASSNEGDTILDPFCGCGTAIVTAQKLKRRWLGIDITHLAITLMKQRLKDSFEGKALFKVIGEPTSIPDAAALATSDPYQFQWWALGLVGARPVEEKKGADKGVDGKIVFQGEYAGEFQSVIISVKAGHLTAVHVRDLCAVVTREKAAIGVLISMEEPTGPMKTEAVTAGFFESQTWGQFPKIQLITVAELLSGKKIEMPPIKQVGATFKKAPKAKGKGSVQQELLSGSGMGKGDGE